MLDTLLGSKLRTKVLEYLFTHSGDRVYVRQLAALMDEDSTNVSRELARLEKLGILVSTIEGKRRYYQANADFPAFVQLKSMLLLTEPGRQRSETSSKVSSVSQRFKVSQRRLAEFCRRHHVKRLALFGYVLREDFRPDSDVDVLVEFEPGHVPGFGIIDMENELSRMIGRKVDLRTPNDLSRYFRDEVVREAEVRYAA